MPAARANADADDLSPGRRAEGHDFHEQRRCRLGRAGRAAAFGAARLYKQVARARGRDIDLAVAASAIASGAAIWTLNPADFRDIPDLRLI